MKEPYYVVIDTETGGLDPHKHSLLTIGMIVTDREFQILGVKSLKIFSQLGTTDEALKINGIDIVKHNSDQDTMFHTNARTIILESLQYWRGYSRSRLIPLGWNVSFDVDFIRAQVVGNEWGEYCTYFNYDIASVAQYRKRSGRLPEDVRGMHATVKHCLGIETKGAHTALIDADWTRQLAAHFEA